MSAAALWALAARLDWPAVVVALAAAYLPLVVVAAALTWANLGLRALRWRLLLGHTAPPFPTLLRTYILGMAAGLVVPASGELARAMLLARHGGLRTSYVLGSVAVEKLLDTGLVVLLLSAGLSRVASREWSVQVATMGGLVFAAALVLAGIAWAAGRLAAPPPPLRRLVRGWEGIGLALAEAWQRFAAGLAAVGRLPPRYRVAIVALTLLSAANACLITVCALAAFGLPADWAVAATLYCALLLGLSVPAAPGALGTFELVAVAVLEAFGQPLARGAAFALGFHAVTFVPPLLAAALTWAWRPARRETQVTTTERDAAGGSRPR